jgi:two-component system nitrogen regulation sensor histidine kinase NtrY
VQDNGAGVPERDRQRVFDPYFTTKSDGTGLGLPIVKKVVLEHHGEITCTETAPHGATFRVRLPLS